MNFKNIAMWAIIVFLTIGLYNMFKNPQSNMRGSNQVIFSEFLTSVDNGEVLKVEIQGNNIKGVYSNGNSFSTYSPNDPNLIEKLSDKGVSISAAPIDEKMRGLCKAVWTFRKALRDPKINQKSIACQQKAFQT